ncbi:hypothetical protein ACIOWI_37670, partial [Streptomyces sp. NPDC087659]|uniref:hypothetical protein n=1 Tax=Streptomyces sp. NPDC087659 TaxID=3365801 RepID=UPI0037F91594
SIQVAGPVRPVPHAADAGTGAPDPRHIPAPSDSAIHALNDRAHQMWVDFHDDTAPPSNPLDRILPRLPHFITPNEADELFRVLNDPDNELATFGGVWEHIKSHYRHACTIQELEILQNHYDHHALKNTPPESIRSAPWKNSPDFAEALRQWPADWLYGIRPQWEEAVAIPGQSDPMPLGNHLGHFASAGRVALPLGELAELRRKGMRLRRVQAGVKDGDDPGGPSTKGKSKGWVPKAEWVWKIFAPTMQELESAIQRLSSVPDRTYVDTSGRVPIHVGAVFHQFETTGVKNPSKSLCSALQKVLQRQGGEKTLSLEGGVWRIDFPPASVAVPVIAAASDRAIDALKDRAHQWWVAFHPAPSGPLPSLPGFMTADRADELFRVLNDPVNELATFGGVRDHIRSRYRHDCTIDELEILQNHYDRHALENPPPNSIITNMDPKYAEKYAEALRQWPANRLHGVLPLQTEKVALPGRETPEQISIGRRCQMLRHEGLTGLPLGELAELRRRGMRPRWVQDGAVRKWKVFVPTVHELEFAIKKLSSVPDRTYVDASGPVPIHVGAVFHQLETTGVCDLPSAVSRAVWTVLMKTRQGRSLEETGGVWRLLPAPAPAPAPAPGADAGSGSSASALLIRNSLGSLVEDVADV